MSSGLLRHHFGSKEGLRDACDEYAMARMAVLREQMLHGGALADPTFIGAIHPEAHARCSPIWCGPCMDGSPTAALMFDRMVEVGEEWLAGTDIKIGRPAGVLGRPGRDEDGHVPDARPDRPGARRRPRRIPSGHSRMLRAAVEIFGQPLLTREQADQASEALDRLTITPRRSDDRGHRCRRTDQVVRAHPRAGRPRPAACGPGRCTASWARTAPARPPPSGSCWA